jgi:hypothetical protein
MIMMPSSLEETRAQNDRYQMTTKLRSGLGSSVSNLSLLLLSFDILAARTSVDEASFDKHSVITVYKTSLEIAKATNGTVDLEEVTTLDAIKVKIFDHTELGRGKTKVVYKVCCLSFSLKHILIAHRCKWRIISCLRPRSTAAITMMTKMKMKRRISNGSKKK